MQSKTKSWKRRILSLAIELALAAAIVWGISTFQTRHLLSQSTDAPGFELASLDGRKVNLADYAGKKVVLYFFAPWCSVCSYSSENIVALRDARSEEELAVLAVGLDFDSVSEVKAFAREHKLNVPVLLGTESTKQDYKIGSYPTVYILDENHEVENKTIGYTTELGLRLRAL